VNAETKGQSKQCMHTYFTKKLKKFELKLSANKLMATVFWDRKGVMMVELMQQGTTVSQMYCKMLRKKTA
jgi:hypothetical protein